VLFRKRSFRRFRWLIGGALIVIGLVVVVMAHRAGTALIRSENMLDPDVIVMLASHEWERLPVAARLARRYETARLLLTQPPIVTRANCQDCGRRVERLAKLGVSERRIVILPLVEGDTYGEAMAARRFMREQGLKRIVVVTSPYHTRRALATFRRVLGPDGVSVGITPAFPESPAAPMRWWLHSYDRWYVTYEWLALVSYRFQHSVPFGIVLVWRDQPAAREFTAGSV